MGPITFTKEEREYFIKSIKKLCPTGLSEQGDIMLSLKLDELEDSELPYITFIKATNMALNWMGLETLKFFIEKKRSEFTFKPLVDADLVSMKKLALIAPLILAATKTTKENREDYWTIINQILKEENVRCP